MPSAPVTVKVPRMSYPVTSLVSLLSAHRVSPWYYFTRIKRGRFNHRPAWAHRTDGGRGGVFEIAEVDFHRALAIGVVDARDAANLGKTFLGPSDIEGSEVGRRIQLRVTDLGRAALVAAEAKETARAEAKAAKVRVVQPSMLIGPNGPVFLPRKVLGP